MGVENTSKRPAESHLMGMLGEGQTGYIEGMESAGQRQLVADSALMPADGPWKDLVALGFGQPEPTDDELFVRTTLPAGWSKVATDHAMHSNVADERGVDRVGVFYKAAFYDRRADCHLINVGGHLGTHHIYGDEPPARPEKWDVLTEQERAGYIRNLDSFLERAKEHPDIYGDRVGRVEALKAAVAD